mmetsp:Transcript_29435/g.80492  ORF Transcript_29435/g.80492 Transcript_29435/m.80492 type:complete len:273 (-) Transcript_29435:265-1083(-)
MIISTARLTASMGTARPTPVEAPPLLRTAVFMPITWPCESSNGPPEFPGLMEASVCMQPWIGRSPTSSVREMPEMTPRLRLCSKPKGFPMAYTVCPTSSCSDSPRANGRIAFRPAWSATRSTAESVAASTPTSRVGNDWESSRLLPPRNMTDKLSGPKSLTTWKFVTTCSASQTKPLPNGAPRPSTMLPRRRSPDRFPRTTETTEGVARRKISAVCFSSAVRARPQAAPPHGEESGQSKAPPSSPTLHARLPPWSSQGRAQCVAPAAEREKP